MDESLWPARNIAEYAYCPRLFYYMEVEGIHLPSADTEQGQRVHRRADQPSAAAVVESATEGEAPAAIRSLTLTSQRLGLTATLDLAEIDGQIAVPVEYRKGRPRRLYADEIDDTNGSGNDVAPWPTDRVQVGLQALLLEEAGYRVPRAVLYYAAEKRRVDVPVDDALRTESLNILAAAKSCAYGPRPLPLVNDPRCPRCSLQPICLPDEVHHQRAADGENGAPAKPRALWPPRDDGIHIVAQQDGTKIGVRGAALTIVDRDGKKLKELPLAGVESLSIVGGVQLSTQALHTLADRCIPVAYLSGSGRLIAMLDPLDSTSAQVRRAQVARLEQAEAALELCRALVSAKIANQRTLLRRNHAAIPTLVADQLADQVNRARTAENLSSLRGHEGQGAALYFQHFAGMFKGELAAEFQATGRQRRPPPDPINAALSFAYSMLTHECTAALRTARLEPSIGAFHASRPGRPALALDLMEPFRPLVADSVVITAFNRGELQAGHFLRTAAGCALTDAGRKAFFAAYGRRLAEEVTHTTFGYKLSYRRMIILHARMIAAWLLGEVPTLAFVTTR
jgi:CRISPR-associated protein Cas1